MRRDCALNYQYESALSLKFGRDGKRERGHIQFCLQRFHRGGRERAGLGHLYCIIDSLLSAALWKGWKKPRKGEMKFQKGQVCIP